MDKIRRLNLDTLSFKDNVVSYDEAVRGKDTDFLPDEVMRGEKQLSILSASKEIDKKCVRLETSY